MDDDHIPGQTSFSESWARTSTPTNGSHTPDITRYTHPQTTGPTTTTPPTVRGSMSRRRALALRQAGKVPLGRESARFGDGAVGFVLKDQDSVGGRARERERERDGERERNQTKWQINSK